MHMQLRLTLVIVAAIAVAGCKAIGPGSIQRDRLDYANAIGDSWKKQALLNIVKLRYFDTPVFLDVASVISSYTLQSQVDIAVRIFPDSRTFGALRHSDDQIAMLTRRPAGAHTLEQRNATGRLCCRALPELLVIDINPRGWNHSFAG